MLTAGLNQLFRGNLDAKIDHLIAVVAEDDLDQILTDVVHIALDGGQHDFAA